MIVRKATLLEQLFGGLHNGADLYPADEIVPPGVSTAQENQVNDDEMRTSQQVAAAVALRAFGKKVSVIENGAIVSQIEPGFPADGKLVPTDRIVAIDGTTVHSPTDIFHAMSGKPIGTHFRFTVLRSGHQALVPLTTVAAAAGSKRGVVGVLLAPSEKIKLPVKVSIDAHGVGGPSAGLAFALDVLQQLGRNVDHGHKVAATGEIFLERRRRPDRRNQAKDDRRARGGCGCLPRSGGECGRGPQVRTRPAHRPCEEFSTGVARAGNLAASPLETWEFRPSERRGNCAFSLQASPCSRAAHA